MIAGCGIIKFTHGFFNFFFHGTIFGFEVERTMLKNDVISFGDINQLHLWGDFAVIINRKPNSITLRKRNSPAANSSGWVVDKSHDLSAAAVGFGSAQVIQLSFDAV